MAQFTYGESEELQMNRKGVEFSLNEVEPGLWKWQFQIGNVVTAGKTRSNLRGLAAHRVQQRIDRELKKSGAPSISPPHESRVQLNASAEGTR